MAGSITVTDTCDGSKWLTGYQFDVSAGSPLGYNLFLDGMRLNANPLPYQNPIGTNQGLVRLPGDGQAHLLTIQDVETSFCAFTLPVQTGKCGPLCTISELTVASGGNVVHEVEVRDFDFYPKRITARVGETIRWIWTGDVPHTTTSDAISGQDVWDSGLLTKGDTFEIVIQTPGIHPYYCIPHGGPGGIGQSGLIRVLPECEDEMQEITVHFNADGGSPDGYKLYIDGELNGGLRSYQNLNGANAVKLLVPADGKSHIVTIQDDDIEVCAASSFYQAIDCSEACTLGGLELTPISSKYTILVRDFDYLPADLVVEAGDTIVFDWVGDIPHTVTSDAITGNSVFNSGLLPKDAEWILVLDEVGNHPYYCIPHGGPGGIGMAASITVVDPCDDGNLLARGTFTSSRLTGSYDVFLNQMQVIDDMPYSGVPSNEFLLSIPADNTPLSLEVVDGINDDCKVTLELDGINCGDPCFGLAAAFDYDINFATRSVQFFDRSSGNIAGHVWSFGDGTASTLSNPIHQYQEPSVYEVCLSVTDDQGCMDTHCDKIRFSDGVCEAGFTYLQSDLHFTFVNTSDIEDPDASILWTFGDGTLLSDMDTVEHTYSPGVYTVCIQIRSDSCLANKCIELDLTDPCLQMTPEFELDKNGSNLQVQFMDLTTGSPDSWLWGFGDGVTSVEQNPSHTYSRLGEYNVCLFVQENENNCSKSLCKTILVGTTSTVEVEKGLPLKAFPNPSLMDEFVNFSGFHSDDLYTEARVMLYDMYGQQVMDKQLYIDDIISLSMMGMQSGLYIVHIKVQERVYQSMIVKL